MLFAAAIGFALPSWSPQAFDRFREIAERTEAKEAGEDSKTSSESEERTDEEPRQEGAQQFRARSPRARYLNCDMIPISEIKTAGLKQVRYVSLAAIAASHSQPSGHRISAVLLAPLRN